MQRQIYEQQWRPSHPETMMHFPPVSDFPPISEKFSDFLKFFYNFTFSRKISSLSSAKISDHFFLVIDHKFRISPLFSLFQYISPSVSRKLFISYFYKFPPLVSPNSPAFYILYVYFVPPYFDHDAFMHHPMHVLDAPGCVYKRY